MDKLINSRLSAYAAFSIGLFLLCSLIYVAIGVDGSNGWWAFDKINDRLLAINLLFITSFIFQDLLYRIFAYFSAFFVAIYATYEVLFIFGFDVNPMQFIIIASLYWAFVSLIYLIIYVTKRNT